MSLSELIRRGAKQSELASYLDAARPEARLAESLALGSRLQAKLFDLAQEGRAITIDDLTPDARPLEPVAHEGRNSLPAFRYFAKVFCRPDVEKHERWGYNRNPPLVATTVGPGYFIALPFGAREVLIDYTLTPPRKPEAWPSIAHKYTRLSRVVFYGTQDVLRGVSAHVSIGRARRGGRWMDNWFVLCRT